MNLYRQMEDFLSSDNHRKKNPRFLAIYALILYGGFTLAQLTELTYAEISLECTIRPRLKKALPYVNRYYNDWTRSDSKYLICTHNGVRIDQRNLGHDLKALDCPWTSSQIKRALLADLIQTGLSYRTIESMSGVHRATVYRAPGFKGNGKKPVKKYTELYEKMTPTERETFAGVLAAMPEQYQEAIKKTLAGEKQKEIALALGVARPRVSQIVNRGFKAIGEYLKDA